MNDSSEIGSVKNTASSSAIRRLAWLTTLVLLIILVFLAVTTPAYYFRADDFAHLVDAKYTSTLDVGALLTKPEFSGHYRPLIKVFYYLMFQQFGLQAWPYYAANLLLFLIFLWLFYALVKELSGRVELALLATLLYLVQTNVYTYTVIWFAAVANLLVMVCVPAAILFYIRWVKAGRFNALFAILSLAAYVVGLLSKEFCLIIPLLVVAYDLLYTWRLPRPRFGEVLATIGRFIPYLLITLLYGYIRFSAGSNLYQNPEHYSFHFERNLLDNSIFFAMQLGFIPGVCLLLSIAHRLLSTAHRPLPTAHWSLSSFESGDLKLLILSALIPLVALAPLIPNPWASPTWLPLPAIGTTIIGALFLALRPPLPPPFSQKMGGGRGGALVLLAAILALNFMFFDKMQESRFLQWGDYTRNVLSEIQVLQPTLPPQAEVVFIDRDYGQAYGADRLFRDFLSDALQLTYGDITLKGRIVPDQESLADLDLPGTVFLFTYADGHLQSTVQAIP